jgi:hypothetical protein
MPIPPCTTIHELCTFTTLNCIHDDILRFHKRACEPVFGVLNRHRRPHRDHNRHEVLPSYLSCSAHLDLWTVLAVLDVAGM